MRIGIDCRVIYDVEKNKGAGVERYVFNLVKNILLQDKKNEYVLFFDKKTSQHTIDSLKKFGHFTPQIFNNKVPFFSNHFFFSFMLWGEWLDRMIFPANVMPFFYIGRSALVIHDVAIYNNPEWFPQGQWFSKMLLVPSSVMKATDIVTVSQTTKDDLLDLFKFKPEKRIHVIYPGLLKEKDSSILTQEKVMKEFNINYDYLLFTGTIEPRKNLLRLLKAFSLYAQETDSKINLLITGAKGWKYKRIFFQIKKINKKLDRRAVKYLGKVTNKERKTLMEKAVAFTFPSLYEGFGFPVLESMASGTPVITSNVSAMAEYIKDQAILVDPESITEIKNAIKKILEDPELQVSLGKKGRELSTQFTWTKTARKLLELI